jgi:uncharacterized protein GlcG (DUF336 family)
MARLWLRIGSGPPLRSRRTAAAACTAQGAARDAPFQPPEGMILRAGGLTIKLGEEVIGAIGVDGAPSAEADEACARAELDKVRDQIR